MIEHDPMNTWLFALREPLTPLSVAVQARQDAKATCDQNQRQAAIFFTGVIGDLLSTLPDPDPWKHLSALLPSGREIEGNYPIPAATGAHGRHGTFGTWKDGADLEPPMHDDPRMDPGLIALSVAMTPEAAAILAAASRDRDGAAADLAAMDDMFDVAAQALCWTMWRRSVYVGRDDDLVDIAFLVWLGWSARILGGGSVTEDDRYGMLADAALADDQYVPVVG